LVFLDNSGGLEWFVSADDNGTSADMNVDRTILDKTNLSNTAHLVLPRNEPLFHRFQKKHNGKKVLFCVHAIRKTN